MDDLEERIRWQKEMIRDARAELRDANAKLERAKEAYVRAKRIDGAIWLAHIRGYVRATTERLRVLESGLDTLERRKNSG